MNEREEDLIIKASKIIHRKTSKDEHKDAQETKDLIRVQLALDVQEAGPWRSSEEVESWVRDYYDLRENQGFDADAATNIANIRELVRISAKVDGALNEQALQSCVLMKVAIYGFSHEEAERSCKIEFKVSQKQRGEQPHKSQTLKDLNKLHSKLNSEINYFRYNFEHQQTPQEAEISARKKLGLPPILTITRDDEPKKDSRKVLTEMPSMYGKSKLEVEEEARKERREHDRAN